MLKRSFDTLLSLFGLILISPVLIVIGFFIRKEDGGVDGHIAEDVNRLVNRVIEDINSFNKTHPQIGERHREVNIAV